MNATQLNADKEIKALYAMYEIPHFIMVEDLAIPQMRPYNVPTNVVQDLLDLALVRDDIKL